MGMADGQAPLPKPQTRRVLCIGGPLDGKWQNTEKRGHQLRILKPARLDYKILSREAEAAEDLRVPFLDYDIYLMEKVALFGESIWVGLHKETLEKADREGTYRDRDSYHVMILRAILQRDVATEMGL